MIRLLTIVGARPQIIKAAAISRAIKNNFSSKISEKILHTGQHYDAQMSQVFFDELDLPHPDFNLHVGPGRHGEQTSKMIDGIEKVLLTENFDATIIYGDTNSTLAGALASAKLNIPVVHIEAGLRSFNMTMPEEQNRIVADHLSSLLFTPTNTGLENLKSEGMTDDKSVFHKDRKRRVYKSGDIMYDNSLYYASVADEKTDILQKYGLTAGDYALATIHRAGNTDDIGRLNSILKALLKISEKQVVVLPLHPRTAKIMNETIERRLYDDVMNSNIKILPPVSYLEMTMLEKNTSIVLTDSGGVQKESYFFMKPCVVMRPETEWVELLEQGTAVIANADTDAIVRAYYDLLCKKLQYPAIFGDGNTSSFILDKVLQYLV